MNQIFIFSFLAGLSLGLEVHQSHSDLIKRPGDKVHIFCTHEKTDYRVMLWYQRLPGDTAMKLIGYLHYDKPSMEDKNEKDFEISGDLGGDTAKNGSLTIQTVKQDHSAVYYCAAREEAANYEAYFGQGTKLTVLENGSHVTAPTVRILQPSKKVCKDKKGKTKRKTLVCVASRFYPDHVSVSWKRNDETTIHNVSTDATATATKTTTKQIFYKITSRLMVQQSDWLKPKTKFTCIVSFYDGKTTINKTDTFTIKSTMIPGMTRENYIKISQNAKLSYSVLIVKSCLYAALVCFLVWKLQGKLGKQTK